MQEMEAVEDRYDTIYGIVSDYLAGNRCLQMGNCDGCL